MNSNWYQLVEQQMLKLREKVGSVNGVVHIGASRLQERGSYNKIGVDKIIWIEALPSIFEEIKHLETEKEKIFNHTIWSEDNKEFDFLITNNDGQSSSILPLSKELKNIFPSVKVIDSIKVKTITMKTFYEKYNVSHTDYDHLCLDVQGAELEVLKGFGSILNNFKSILCEVSYVELYENQPLINDIDLFLKDFNFYREKGINYTGSTGVWTDALYINKNFTI